MPRIIRHLAAALLPLAAVAAGALAVVLAVQLPARPAYDSAVPAVVVPGDALAVVASQPVRSKHAPGGAASVGAQGASPSAEASVNPVATASSSRTADNTPKPQPSAATPQSSFPRSAAKPPPSDEPAPMTPPVTTPAAPPAAAPEASPPAQAPARTAAVASSPLRTIARANAAPAGRSDKAPARAAEKVDKAEKHAAEEDCKAGGCERKHSGKKKDDPAKKPPPGQIATPPPATTAPPTPPAAPPAPTPH